MYWWTQNRWDQLIVLLPAGSTAFIPGSKLLYGTLSQNCNSKWQCSQFWALGHCFGISCFWVTCKVSSSLFVVVAMHWVMPMTFHSFNPNLFRNKFVCLQSRSRISWDTNKIYFFIDTTSVKYCWGARHIRLQYEVETHSWNLDSIAVSLFTNPNHSETSKLV